MNVDKPRPHAVRTTFQASRWITLNGRPHHPTVPRSFRIIILGVLGVLTLLAAFVVPTLRAATTSVDIVGFAFQPETVTIAVGDTVTWTNLDDVSHSATESSSSPPRFDTGVFDFGSRSLQFNTAGTFEYFCVIHPGMRGSVVVEGPDVMEEVYLPFVQR